MVAVQIGTGHDGFFQAEWQTLNLSGNDTFVLKVPASASALLQPTSLELRVIASYSATSAVAINTRRTKL
jgi:hypothetical protein